MLRSLSALSPGCLGILWELRGGWHLLCSALFPVALASSSGLPGIFLCLGPGVWGHGLRLLWGAGTIQGKECECGCMSVTVHVCRSVYGCECVRDHVCV